MFEIILYQPEIPFNTGNIGRLCLSNDCKLHLVKPLGFSLEDRYLKRAGLDYWEHVDLVIHESLDEAIQFIGVDRDYYYLSTHSQKVYWEQKFKEGDVFVFGPETRGIPKDILARYSSHCLTIPMSNRQQVRSLNLSTSAGIVLYEAIRQTY